MRVTDTKNELQVGTRVFVYGSEHLLDHHGVVTEITDFDGDVDEYGRGITIFPEVKVRFDDGTEDSFTTSYGEITWADYPDGPDEVICEDLVKEAS